MSAWFITVTFTPDAEGPPRSETFGVEADDQRDAEHAALKMAADAWNVPHRYGVSEGTFRIVRETV